MRRRESFRTSPAVPFQRHKSTLPDILHVRPARPPLHHSAHRLLDVGAVAHRTRDDALRHPAPQDGHLGPIAPKGREPETQQPAGLGVGPHRHLVEVRKVLLRVPVLLGSAPRRRRRRRCQLRDEDVQRHGEAPGERQELERQQVGREDAGSHGVRGTGDAGGDRRGRRPRVGQEVEFQEDDAQHGQVAPVLAPLGQPEGVEHDERKRALGVLGHERAQAGVDVVPDCLQVGLLHAHDDGPEAVVGEPLRRVEERVLCQFEVHEEPVWVESGGVGSSTATGRLLVDLVWVQLRGQAAEACFDFAVGARRRDAEVGVEVTGEAQVVERLHERVDEVEGEDEDVDPPAVRGVEGLAWLWVRLAGADGEPVVEALQEARGVLRASGQSL